MPTLASRSLFSSLPCVVGSLLHFRELRGITKGLQECGHGYPNHESPRRSCPLFFVISPPAPLSRCSGLLCPPPPNQTRVLASTDCDVDIPLLWCGSSRNFSRRPFAGMYRRPQAPPGGGGGATGSRWVWSASVGVVGVCQTLSFHYSTRTSCALCIGCSGIRPRTCRGRIAQQ